MAHGKWWVTTSFLFLASCAFAQVPTPIRSVSTLPATCKGGNPAQSSDMVVLIVAGVGTNYLCTAPNVWTQVAGGSGSPPGGTTGDTQFNSGVGVFGGTISEVNAVAFAGADICAQINAAITALPAEGGTVIVPGGNWPACAGSGGIGITITKPIILRGVESGSGLAGNTGATTINLAAGVTGIDISGGGAKSSVRDLFLMSASAGAGTDDGIRVRAGSVTIHNSSFKHFGRNGIRVDSGNIGGSADFWHFEDTQTDSNFGDGMRWACPSTDNNLGTGIQLDSSLNGGWGYYIDCGGGNQFLTTHATQNTLGGAFIAASNQRFYNFYVESGVGSSFVIDNSTQVTGVFAEFQASGQPTTITNPTPSNSANHIQYVGPDGFPVQNGLFLGSEPGGAGNRTYMERVDAVTGALNLFDYTGITTLFNYDPTSKWLFGSKITPTSSATLPGLNVGVIPGDPSTLTNGDMWYDTVSNKFRCYENGGSTDCIGGGGSVTHTSGPLTSGNLVIGNGAADVKVDPNANTDAAGNVVAVSFQTSGVNGGFTGVEGTGAGLTAGSGVDLLYPDSTLHCWHQNLNNTDGGCALRSLGAGLGSIFGTTAVNSITQTTQTPWALTFLNTVATAASAGGLGMYVSDVGDAFIIENTLTGTVTASIGMRQNGELLLDGNGAAGDPAAVQFSIPNVATADFLFENGSSVTTGSPRIRLKGKSTGEAAISVPAAAGTPNDILLPTTTGAANALLRTDGGTPQQTSWTGNCAAAGSAANPSIVACSAASAGSFSCATAASTGTCQINTTAVTANSEIFVTQRADTTTGTRLSVTCNTGVTTVTPVITAVTAGTSFTINLGTVAVNPECFSYFIVN